MKNFLKLAVASMILIAPAAAMAQAHPGGVSAHMRPALFHDRSPRPHVHNIQPHH
jgi:hypothetical protein